MDELAGGIRRVTLPLPTRPGHVHAYLLPGDDGWTIVDTGLGLPDARERWAAELDGVPGGVARIVVTHFHPDHVGAARDLAELTGAPVLQGRLDYEQCALVWGGDEWVAVLVDWFKRHGVPDEVTAELIEQGSQFRPFIRYQPDPQLLEPGDLVDGWEAVAAPGHADGQLMLLRDGILVAADHLLDRISPTVGLWPRSRPDPLGDYLGALEATIALDPELAIGGHGEPIRDPPGVHATSWSTTVTGSTLPRRRSTICRKPGTRSPCRCSAPTSSPARAASRSRRPSRTSSASCTTAGPGGTRPSTP